MLYGADLDWDPRNIHMLPFIYQRKLTGNSETIVTFLNFLDLSMVLKHVVLEESLIRSHTNDNKIPYIFSVTALFEHSCVLSFSITGQHLLTKHLWIHRCIYNKATYNQSLLNYCV